MFWKKKKSKLEIPKGPALSCVHVGHCSKEKCPLWVILDSTINVDGIPKTVKEGACSFAWMPRLTIELRHHLTIALKEDRSNLTL